MSKPAELTPWFPPEVKPVREGVYESGRPFRAPWFSLWKNGTWHMGAETPEAAATISTKIDYPREWRGLAKRRDSQPQPQGRDDAREP